MAPISRKNLSINRKIFSKSWFLIIFPLPFVFFAIQISICSPSLLLPFVNFTLIHLTVWIEQFTYTSVVPIPLAFYFISSAKNISSNPFSFIVFIVSCKVISIFIIKGALTLNIIFNPVSFKNVSIKKYY